MSKAIEIIQDISGYIGSFATWLIKQIFTEDKLSEKIILDIRSGNNGININCGESGSITLWMSVRNYTAFEQTLDNLTVKYYHGGSTVKFRNDRRETIPAFAEQEIHLDEKLSPEEARKIALCEDSYSDPYLSYDADFSNRLYKISKSDTLNHLFAHKINDHIYAEEPQKAKAGGKK